MISYKRVFELINMKIIKMDREELINFFKYYHSALFNFSDIDDLAPYYIETIDNDKNWFYFLFSCLHISIRKIDSKSLVETSILIKFNRNYDIDKLCDYVSKLDMLLIAYGYHFCLPVLSYFISNEKELINFRNNLDEDYSLYKSMTNKQFYSSLNSFVSRLALNNENISKIFNDSYRTYCDDKTLLLIDLLYLYLNENISSNKGERQTSISKVINYYFLKSKKIILLYHLKKLINQYIA